MRKSPEVIMALLEKPILGIGLSKLSDEEYIQTMLEVKAFFEEYVSQGAASILKHHKPSRRKYFRKAASLNASQKRGHTEDFLT